MHPPPRRSLALAALAWACLLPGCGGSFPAPVTGDRSATATTAGATTAGATTVGATSTGAGPVPAAPAPRATVTRAHDASPPRTLPPGPPAASPGSLPQTTALPSAQSAEFRAEMAALWQGVRLGDAEPAMPAFFPERAYTQLKTIGDPAGDYVGRLVGDYALDIGAAHALLGTGAQGAVLVDVVVPSSYAHWVPPGVCDNGVGYYEVPNARVLYREGGELRSFGIASMISWRGVWYVIHLGAIVRPSATGMTDDPSLGPGSPVPSSTC